MTAQRQAGRARANKPAPSKISSKVASAAERETDDSETLTDRAYRRLEELIVTLQLPPGTMLSEQSLAAATEASAGPRSGRPCSGWRATASS